MNVQILSKSTGYGGHLRNNAQHSTSTPISDRDDHLYTSELNTVNGGKQCFAQLVYFESNVSQRTGCFKFDLELCL